MSEIRTAYRSLHPDETAPAVTAALAARSAALNAAQAHAEALFGTPHVTCDVFYRWDGGFHVAGWAATEGFTSDLPLPPGTRYDAKARRVRPAKRTPEGKALAEEMAAYGFPLIDGLGGIVSGYHGDEPPAREDRYRVAHYLSGWTFHVLDGDVFATLPLGCLDDALPDPDRWVKVPLSEYHLASERTKEPA